MSNQIFPYKYKTQNCIENCLANLCDAAEIDYRILFLNSWDFGYNDVYSTIGQNIHYRYSGELSIMDYATVLKHINTIIEVEKLDINDIKKRCDNGWNFIVESDSYACPWNMAYKKYHHPHYYLLGGNMTELYAVDSYCTLKFIKVDEKVLSNSKNIFSIKMQQIDSDKSLLVERIKKDFINFIKLRSEQGVYKLINRFANDMSKAQSLEILTPQLYDLSETHIIRRLSYISNARYNTSLLMSYLGIDKKLIEQMKELYGMWNTTKNLCIKVLLTKKMPLLQQTSELVCLIAKKECELAENIVRRID